MCQVDSPVEPQRWQTMPNQWLGWDGGVLEVHVVAKSAELASTGPTFPDIEDPPV